MTLSTFQPSTSIRPLGEEHLRMFRRMTGEGEAVPRVTLPKEVTPIKVKVTLGTTKVRYKEAKITAKTQGGRLATLAEVLRDPQMMKNKEVAWTTVDPKSKLPRKKGFYRVSPNGALKLVSEEVACKLDWKRCLYVYGSLMHARHVIVYGYFGGQYGLGVDRHDDENQAALTTLVIE